MHTAHEPSDYARLETERIATAWVERVSVPLRRLSVLRSLVWLRISFVTVLAVGVVMASGCTVRSRRPDGPYREAQEFVDALSDVTVDCTREHAPSGEGRVVVAADMTHAGEAPAIHDAGSSSGTEAVLECVRKGAAEKLRSPKSAPAPYAEVRVPLPLVTSKVTYAFVRELPASGS